MITAFLDIETTGLLAPDHRIVEIYISLYKDRTKVWSYDQRINPERAISVEAQRVHKISSSDLLSKPSWDVVGPVVEGSLKRADYFVWHNGDEFDGPFIDQELKRIGLTGIPKKPSIDTMLHGVWSTPDGKKPRLSELCLACGVTYDPTKAHAAQYDVDVMAECYFKGLDWGFFTLPQQDGLSIAA